MADVYDKLRGTLTTLFRFGKGGPQIKNNGGVIEARNAVDGAFAILRGLDAVGSNDLMTKGVVDSGLNTRLVVAQMPIALVTKVSTAVIPDNAVVVDCWLDVTTPYDNGATLDVQRTGDAGVAPMGTGDNDLSVAAVYRLPQVTSWGSTGAGTVTATISTGVPTVGASTLYLLYVTPVDIS